MPKILIIDTSSEKLEHFSGMQTHRGFVQDFANKQLIGDYDQGLQLEYPLYFVSPANSKGFMNGGIDAGYMGMFHGIQQQVQERIRKLGKKTLLGTNYFPIGSAFCTEVTPTGKYDPNHRNFLITAPTMLYPQPVQDTQNAYWATLAAIKVWPREGTFIIAPMCCGYGDMAIEESSKQMMRGMRDGMDLPAAEICLSEPNLDEQPRFYENTEFFTVPHEQIVQKK